MARFQLPPPDASLETHQKAFEEFKELLTEATVKKSAEEQMKIKNRLAVIEANKRIYNQLPAPFKQDGTQAFAIMHTFFMEQLQLEQKYLNEQRDWPKEVEDWIDKYFINSQ